jgi:glutaredoxin 2
LEFFKSHRQQIEVALFQAVRQNRFSSEALETPTRFMGDNILAALQLGDLSFMNEELDWVRSLLKSNNIPEQALGMYMQLYADAVHQNINGAGKPITDWLFRYKKGNA